MYQNDAFCWAGEKDIRTYVQRKREVFLVHMACDNKREEIAGLFVCIIVVHFDGLRSRLVLPKVRLDAMAKAKEDALAASQQTLDEDAKKFEDYLQDPLDACC